MSDRFDMQEYARYVNTYRAAPQKMMGKLTIRDMQGKYNRFDNPFPEQVTAMADAIENADGKILAYCRSGTRSTLLWALARAAKGDHPAVLSEQAADAGYDLSPVAAMMDMLRGRAS